MLTGHPDVDRVVILSLNLEDVQTLCSINQHMKKCYDDVIKQLLKNAKIKVDITIGDIKSQDYFIPLPKPYQKTYYYAHLLNKLNVDIPYHWNTIERNSVVM